MAMNTRNSEVYQQWNDGFIVRRMRQDEGQQVIKWCSELTSMSCDLEVALCARDEDTVGFFVGELNGKMIASLVEIPVSDDVRYIGCVYVEERHRKSGFARRMITTARDVSDHHNGASIVALDTHPYLESMYEKFGHKIAFKSANYSGTVITCDIHNRFGTDVRQVDDTVFDRLMSYDNKCFSRPGSAWRHKFMSHWLKIPDGRAVVAVSRHGDVVGYGCRRPSVNKAQHHHIGPLYADMYEIAWDLIHSVTDDIIGHTIQLTVMEPNKDAVRLVDEMKLKLSVPMIRMCHSGRHEAVSSRVFAITSLDVCGF